MGIKGLNNILQNTCSKNIYKLSLWELNGKTIAIDTSIYLYKFNRDGDELIDGFYHMISLFNYNKIRPLFVFDGKPPREKYKLLQKRRIEKKKAEFKYNTIKESSDLIPNARDIIELRNQFIRVSKKDICNVKKLFNLMGVSYYECDGESDAVCVQLVKMNIAYACMSEDMDMFVYGCNKVLRYLSLLNSTVVLYDLKGILHTLKISFKDFQTICIISGTDYNDQFNNNINLKDAINIYMMYKDTYNNFDYQEWLIRNKYIKDICAFNKICELFDITSNIKIPTIINNNHNIIGAKTFLEEHGFVFME